MARLQNRNDKGRVQQPEKDEEHNYRGATKLKIEKSILETVKHVVGKIVGAGATVLLSSNAIDVIVSYVSTPSPETALALKALSLVTAYAIWKGAIVPLVERVFEEANIGTSTPVKTTTMGSYLSIV